MKYNCMYLCTLALGSSTTQNFCHLQIFSNTVLYKYSVRYKIFLKTGTYTDNNAVLQLHVVKYRSRSMNTHKI